MPIAEKLPSAPRQEEGVLAHAIERLRDELEVVSYAISHDLQAPLRALQSGCEALTRHPGFDADAQGREELQMLSQETTRLKSLMQDMLEYVRLETFPVTHNAFDSNDALRTVINALEQEISATGAAITYDALPQLVGHRGRITRLFAHLLENAIKFNAAAPVIHISARRLESGWEFCMADNGIGIDDEYHDSIFRLFQRLHAGDAYTGNGAGLALSRKIVESHGGKLWVESGPNAGSRFYFTLPYKP